jgi:hypothetical protein
VTGDVLSLMRARRQDVLATALLISSTQGRPFTLAEHTAWDRLMWELTEIDKRIALVTARLGQLEGPWPELGYRLVAVPEEWAAR